MKIEMGIEKQTISCRLDEETIQALKKLAEEENRTISNLIETIIKRYFSETKSR